jgi:outer membrane receptor protein involved in Fe transport
MDGRRSVQILTMVVLSCVAAGRVEAQTPPKGAEKGSGKADSSATDVQRVTVTARRVEEVAQQVPIPVAVVTGKAMDNAGTFNVSRLQQVVPSLQCYTTNPRTMALNRASGSTSTASFIRGRQLQPSTSSMSIASKSCAARKARYSARTPRLAR